MPGSRGNSEAASRAKVAAWQARRFPSLAPRNGPSLNEALPDDLFADSAETRRILDEFRSSE